MINKNENKSKPSSSWKGKSKIELFMLSFIHYTAVHTRIRINTVYWDYKLWFVTKVGSEMKFER